MAEEDFKSVHFDVDFKMFWSLQGLNKMYDKQVADAMSENDNAA